MTSETLKDLNIHTLIGYTSKRGKAWHYRANEQGDEPNHYVDEVPLEDVKRRLFDWQAIESDLYGAMLTEDGVTTLSTPEFKGIFRSDTGFNLGVKGKGYQIHQYPEWLLTNIANLLDTDLKIGSAGLLKQGRQAWVQIEMPETMEAGGIGVEPVKFRPFLTGATSHDGSLSTTFLTGAQVVVCDNTLSAALGSSDTHVKVRHSSGSLKRIGDVRAALGVVHQVAEQFQEQVAALTRDYVSDETWKNFVAAVTFPGSSPSARSVSMAQTKVAEITRLWDLDERVAPWRNTKFGVLQAMNTYEHHIKTVRGATRPERNMARLIEGGVDALDRGTLAELAKVS